MKSKINLFILFFAFFAHDASAYKIIINGNGRTHRYYIVETNNEMMKCVGRGSLYCPIYSASAQSYASGKWYDLGEVVDFVIKQIESGIKKGEENYNDDLPLRWKMQDDENYEIDIEENGIRGLKEFEEKY